MTHTTVFGVVLLSFLFEVPALAESSPQQTAGELYQQGLYLEEGKGDLKKALDIYQKILTQFPSERNVGAKAQLHIGLCMEKLGLKEATRAYQKVLADFADQKQVVNEARSRLAALKAYAGDAVRPTMSVRKVWEGLDVDDCGEISPDGKHLSYTDWETGHLALYEVATGKKRLLTHSGSSSPARHYTEYALNSRWSPDGKHLVYEWDKVPADGESSEDLRIIGLDGSAPRVLCTTDDSVKWMEVCDWSPDGKSIYALRKIEPSTVQIVMISVEDARLKVVGTLRNWVNHASLSQDGRFMVYDRPSDTQHPVSRHAPPHDIYIVSMDDGIGIPLITHAAHDIVLSWGVDGKHLLFTSDRSGTPDMWAIAVRDGKAWGAPRLVKPGKGPIAPVGLGHTSDGSFYYCQHPNVSDVFVTELDPRTDKITAEPQVAVDRFEGSNAAPAYSPDGKYLAYISRREPLRIRQTVRPVGNVLCIRNLETGQDKEIRPGLEGFGFPKWFPDSRSVIVVQWLQDEMALYRIDVHTGDTTRVLLLKEPERINAHDVSIDGKSIFILRTGVNEHEQKMSCKIVRREIESGAETELYADTSVYVYTFSRSPDGLWLAFVGQDGILKIMPSAGGVPRGLYTLDEKDKRWRCLEWTADGKSILMPKLLPNSDLQWDLWRIPLDGRKPESFGLQMNVLWQVSAHPDGRHLSFSTQGPEFKMPEVWVMENFLPEGGFTDEAGAEPTGHAPGMRLRKVANVERTVYPQQGTLLGHISPDGRHLSFVDWETGDLALFNVSTGEVRRVTGKGSWDDSSANAENSIWSRDGSKLAFLWDDYRSPALCVINADGSNPRVVLRDTTLIWTEPYDWSPDGKSILALLQRKDLSREIALVSATDGSIRRVLAPPYGDWRDFPIAMNFSPDGKRIVYDLRAGSDAKGHDIHHYTIADRTHVPLVTHPADDYVVGWSGSGGEIFFASSRTGTYGLWALPLDGMKARGEPRLIAPDIGAVSPIGPTRDGSLYYSPPFGNTPDVYSVNCNPSDGKSITQPVKIIMDVEGRSITPAFSPCGKYLAYVSGFRDRKGLGGTVLRIQTLETGMTQEFRPQLPSFAYPRWSGDSQSLFLLARGDDQKPLGIYQMSRYSEQVTPVVTDCADELRGHLPTRDGRSIILARADPRGQDRAWKITERDLETETEKELHRGSGENFYGFDISPDGERLAVLTRAPGSTIRGIRILVGPTRGGELKEICRPERAARQLAWAADGEHILFCMRQSSSENWGLWRVAAKGGKPEYLHTEMVGEMRSLTAHPDGTRIAFFARGPIRNAEIWAVENMQPEPGIKR